MTATTDAPAPAPAKKRRGRETVFDMVRTLVVVFALVLPMYLFHQGGPDSRKHVRAVDPTEVFALASRDLGVPVVTAAPKGWTCTVRDTATTEGVARVGYVVGDHYVEWAAGKGEQFLLDQTGKADRVGTDVVSGTTWQLYRDDAGAESLVLQRRGATLVLGGVRETVTRAELETLAAAVR